MAAEILDLLGQPHQIRILFALRKHGVMRFGEIERTLALNPTQVDRALKALTARVFVIPTTHDAGDRIVLAYDLSRRGHAILDALDAFTASLERHKDVVGETTVRDLDAALLA